MYRNHHELDGYDDDDAQMDGEAYAPAFAGQAAQFQPASAGQPWLAQPQPPWHMWGSTQQQIINPASGGASSPLVGGPAAQMCKVSYGRPETWHWVFSAKLIAGPDTNAVGEHVILVVHWDLIIGIGRASIIIPDFDQYQFDWNDGAAFPANRHIWSTQTISPGKTFTAPPPTPAGTSLVDSFVAQDIQLQARCVLQELSIPSAPVTVELSAQFSPKNHIRPDWYLPPETPPEAMFAGKEIGAR